MNAWDSDRPAVICLSIEQEYPEIANKADEPISETAIGLMNDIGLQVVDDDELCDARLSIQLTGYALGASYRQSGGCISGAEYDVEFALTSDGETPFTFRLHTEKEPSNSISGCNEDPAKAPFKNAWIEALLDGIASIWGPYVYVYGLQEPGVNQPMFTVAYDRLTAMGPDAVPLLIDGLNYSEPMIRRNSAYVLDALDKDARPSIPALIDNLEDEYEGSCRIKNTEGYCYPNLFVRDAAIRALGDFGPYAIDAVPLLIQILEEDIASHNLPAIRKVTKSLREITGQDFGEDPAAWREYWEQQ
jgi:hypothetical protein